MKFLPLIWAGLWRKRLRAILTLASVTVAFTLFGLLIGLNASFQHIVDVARADRITINPRFDNELPMSMTEELMRMPGITAAAPAGFVGGYYKKEGNNAFAAMIDDRTKDAWSDIPLSAAQYKILAANRTGAFFSRKVVERWNLKVGDVFPLTSPGIKRADGKNVWSFTVLGITEDFSSIPTGYIAGNLAYYEESRAPEDRGRVDQYIVLVDDPKKADAMVKTIDKHFANSGSPTRSITEKKEYDMSGSGIDMPFFTQTIAISGLLMILFLTGNSIAQSVRERIPEFAVLKTMGFSDTGVMALVFAEAALPCLLGAGIGMALAAWISQIFPRLLPPGLGLPAPYMTPGLFLVAFACALGVAGLSAMLPASRIARLDVATALSGR